MINQWPIPGSTVNQPRLLRYAWLVPLIAVLPPFAMGQPVSVPAAAYPDPPQVLFQDLFVAVQTAPVFADSKVFADAVPNAAPEEILAQYHALHPESPRALEHFVDAHFALPAQTAAVLSPPITFLARAY